tara:strand:+ start:9891 stop:10160 length:270 start_codon:yes stop_codon:yes gene_type:complete
MEIKKTEKYEAVDKPLHYQSKQGFQVVDIIEAYNLNFNLGNVLKYVCRAGNKPNEGRSKDLRKALWYLHREVNVQDSDLEGLAGYTNHD